jgi:hypothetical protein
LPAWNDPPSIENSYGAVPLVATAVKVTEFSEHLRSGAEAETVKSAGTFFTITDASMIQPILSLTVSL